uniref:Kinesin motor domain-containing protein n=1 Tax=Spongospora subterranea TaxID=70186 RepID=A0A0H5QV61_9EUKA|eukprot:CRZ05481.1 hypothetical protein [Spongospora subterranea]
MVDFAAFSPDGRRRTLLRVGHGDVLAAFHAGVDAPLTRRQALSLWMRSKKNCPAASSKSGRSLDRRQDNGNVVIKSKTTTTLKQRRARLALADKENIINIPIAVKSDINVAHLESTLKKTSLDSPAGQSKSHTNRAVALYCFRLWFCYSALRKQQKHYLLLRCFNAWRLYLCQVHGDAREVSLHSHVCSLETQLAAMHEEFAKHELVRRTLHEQVQDLRGSIRIMARLRPGTCHDSGPTIVPLSDGRQEVVVDGLNKTHRFRFDHVFHRDASQEDVFDVVLPLIQSACDGFNVNIFAYGATNSGKTFTLVGPESQTAPGIVFRSADAIFAESKRLACIKNHVWFQRFFTRFLSPLIQLLSTYACLGISNQLNIPRNLQRHSCGPV